MNPYIMSSAAMTIAGFLLVYGTGKPISNVAVLEKPSTSIEVSTMQTPATPRYIEVVEEIESARTEVRSVPAEYRQVNRTVVRQRAFTEVIEFRDRRGVWRVRYKDHPEIVETWVEHIRVNPERTETVHIPAKTRIVRKLISESI